MNLPNCPSPVNGDRTSVNADGELRSACSDLGESNGGGRESPRVLPAVDRSSKDPQVSGDRSAIFRRPWWSWLVGKCCWRCEEPVPSGGASQIRRDQRRRNGSWPRLSSSNRRRSGRFTATKTVGIQRSASKLQIGTKHGR